MKTWNFVKRIISNEYFPAAAVLAGVILFWGLGFFGGLSLLSHHQSLLTTLTWLLFVYGAAVLTPLAGVIAATDLVRRWRRNRQYAQAGMAQADLGEDGSYEDEPMQEAAVADESLSAPLPSHPATSRHRAPVEAPSRCSTELAANGFARRRE